MRLENHLIEHCAPTLASLKTASLFRSSYNSQEELQSALESLREMLMPKGICVEIMRQDEKYVLLYVYRPSRLAWDLNKSGVMDLLETCGYEENSVEYALERLKQRIEEGDSFPHEIGLFLGYPLGDVQGFIENKGQNCKCVGCWKVYCDECEARKLFARYEKCREIYKKLFHGGQRSLGQLTVAA